MTKILESKDYSRFVAYPINRKVEKIKKLVASMSAHGWIDAYPAHCCKLGDTLVLKGGHHRFAVAKMLGLPVKYVVCDDTATIHELEQATNHWTMVDHLDSHCEAGKSAYLEVREFCRKSGIGVTQAISMLGGNCASSANMNNKFKAGEFVIRGLAHANTVANIVQHLRQCGVPFYNASSLVNAISKIVMVEGFDTAKLKQRIKQYTYVVQRQATVDDYMRMLEEVYNRNSKGDRIPVAFLAAEGARQRSATKSCSRAA